MGLDPQRVQTSFSADGVQMFQHAYPMIVALAGGFMILLMKLAAFYVSNSMALKSDALESLVNLLAGSFAFYAILYGKKPADRDHPYGHGKIEYVSSFFEGGLITLAAVLISYESVENLVRGIALKELGTGLLINFTAGSLNGLLGFWLVRMGRKKNSAAMEADGHHLLSDFVTSAGILVGLLTVHFTGLSWLDPAVALVFGLWLGFTGIRVLYRSVLSLMDTENPESMQRLVDAMNELQHPDVLNVHAMRAMHIGDFVHVDVHLVLPQIYDVQRANRIVHDFEHEVLEAAQMNGEFHSHVDPCMQLYCAHCRAEDCAQRLDVFQGSRPDFQVEGAVVWPHALERRVVHSPESVDPAAPSR